MTHLDVQVVGGQDELKQSGLVDLTKVEVPSDNVIRALLVLLILRHRRRVLRVVLAVFDNFGQNLARHVGKRNGGVRTGILNQLRKGKKKGESMVRLAPFADAKERKKKTKKKKRVHKKPQREPQRDQRGSGKGHSHIFDGF